MTDDWDEGAYCVETASALRGDVERKDWDAIQSTLNSYCHEGFGVGIDGIGICSYAVDIVHAELPAEVKSGIPIRSWPKEYQEMALKVAQHVIERLDSGSSGC